MAFVPVPDAVEVEVRMTLDSQKIENTLYFNYTTPPTLETFQALGGFVLDWWETHYAANVCDALQLREVVLTDLAVADGVQVTVAPSAPAYGALGAAVAPNNVAFCVSFRTEFRGRSRRGRNYVSGLAKTEVDGNTLTPSRVTGIVSAYNNLLPGGEIPNNWLWVVVSRYSNKVPRVEGVITPILGALATDSTVDSMRRRLPGRGQ